ncbi:hypothetical protein [Streptacidiphilus fuscans]|uniref:Uncharacterized protein n=1 Tax=Streptacidiphilus fuscans TaxID=2789292 RepID=A0A931B6K7_9ACTN|nr:hypothetical protein [Streptacidiphilus fuscans]MBF9071364.1 hypothetical protein [Streptacidiphilus fuscans]
MKTSRVHRPRRRSAPFAAVLAISMTAAVSATTPDFVLTSEAGDYESLFGPWLPSRNPSWR